MEDKELLQKSSLNISLLPKSEEDTKLASLLKYKSLESMYYCIIIKSDVSQFSKTNEKMINCICYVNFLIKAYTNQRYCWRNDYKLYCLANSWCMINLFTLILFNTKIFSTLPETDMYKFLHYIYRYLFLLGKPLSDIIVYCLCFLFL